MPEEGEKSGGEGKGREYREGGRRVEHIREGRKEGRSKD